MATPCDQLLSDLQTQFAADFQVLPAADGCLVATPYTQPDLAAVEFTVQPLANGYLLTDQGDTIGTLFVNGLTITNAIRQEMKSIARIHGVDFDGAAFHIVANSSNVIRLANQLAHAIQAASFLIYKTAHRPPSRFEDEVETYLIEQRLVYQTDYTIRGYATTHQITFYLNHNRNILLEPLSASSPSASKDKAKRLSFQWADLRKNNIQGHFLVVIDDSENRWETVWSAPNNDALSILTGYSDQVIRWQSERLQLQRFLVGPSH